MGEKEEEDGDRMREGRKEGRRERMYLSLDVEGGENKKGRSRERRKVWKERSREAEKL